MKLRLVCFYTLLVALGASTALSAGHYQRTKDGKVTVWNDDPKAGDTAAWSGGRDNEGFASGVGTLIWYTGDGALYARYHGKMVRGKFDGTVDATSRGKTAHAVFAYGKRSTRWVPAKPSSVAIASASTSATPSQASSPQTALPKAARRDQATKRPAASQPTPIAAAARQNLAKREDERPMPIANPPSKDIPAEGPATEREPQTEAGAEPSVLAPAPEATRPTITIEDKPEVADFSGPPPSLREDSAAETARADATAQIASSPAASAQLTSSEATALADGEARARGYDLAGYQRPKADYSAVKAQWSFFYNSNQPNGGAGRPEHFIVTVDDATRQAELRQ